MKTGAERQRIEVAQERGKQRGGVATERVEHGDVVCTDWDGKKKKEKVFHLQGPYLEVDTAECDCSHWVEIIDAFGGENIF